MLHRFCWTLLILCCLLTPARGSDELPDIRITRPSWDATWFHTEIFRFLLRDLGYNVSNAKTMAKAEVYKAISKGDVDLWFNYEPQLDQRFLTKDIAPHLEPRGHIYIDGLFQGLLIDLATVDRFNIKSLSDLKRPAIKKIYDNNNNGKAEIMGCDKNWACFPTLQYLIKSHGLEEHVEQISTTHNHLALIAIERLSKQQPFIIHAWYPHWFTQVFKPGKLSAWLPVIPGILQKMPGKEKTKSQYPSLKGCLLKPCDLGYAFSDLRAIGNRKFFIKHPDIGKLLDLVKIPPEDISKQHKRMYDGEDEMIDIRHHAEEWIARNHLKVDEWLAAAKKLQTAKISQLIQQRKKKFLRVVIKPFEPLVLTTHNQFTGFSIELWESIARDLELEFQMVLVHSMAKLLSELQRKKADLGISGIGITSSREDTMDFTHPILTSGLQIMVPEFKPSIVGIILSIVISWQFISVAIGLLIILFLAAHIIWFIEKGKNHEGFPTTYWRGIMESIWWAGAITSGREGWGKPLATPAAKMFTFFWMFIGYFIFVYFTATMSSSFTVKEVTHNINTIEDLKDKKVVTLKYSVAEEYLLKQGLKPITVRNIDEAYDMIESGKVDAMVYHALVMKYYISQRGKGKMTLVGDTFYQQEYGFALKHNSPIREEINRSLLKLEESGAFQQLYNKWFGQEVS